MPDVVSEGGRPPARSRSPPARSNRSIEESAQSKWRLLAADENNASWPHEKSRSPPARANRRITSKTGVPAPPAPPPPSASNFQELLEDNLYPGRRSTGDEWAPVTNWKELFTHRADCESRDNASDILWRVVKELASSRRQILYKMRKRSEQYDLQCAVVSDGSLRETSGAADFGLDFGQGRAKHAGDRVLFKPWVEAAVKVSVGPLYSGVKVRLLSRDRNERSNVVNAQYKESNTTRLLMCFVLALGTHLLTRHGFKLEASKITLDAVDDGSGKLIKYYKEKYGMHLVGSQGKMQGDLLLALRLCGQVWGAGDSGEAGGLPQQSHTTCQVQGLQPHRQIPG